MTAQVVNPTAEDRLWCADQVARHTHRPGWTLAVGQHPETGHLGIAVYATVLDSRGSDREIMVTSWTAIPSDIYRERDEDALTEWIWNVCISRMEAHEAAEWFRRDGKIYYDPHAEEEENSDE